MQQSNPYARIYSHMKVLTMLMCSLISLNLAAQKTTYYPKDSAVVAINKIVSTISAVHPNPYFRYDSSYIAHSVDSLIQTWDSTHVAAKGFVSSSMKIAALMSNGHTQVDWMSKGIYQELKSYKYLPVQLKVDNGAVYVLKSAQKGKQIENKQVISINGIASSQLLGKYTSYIGGEPHFKQEHAGLYCSIYGFLDETITPPYKFKFDDGEEIELKGVGVLGVNKLLQGQRSPKKAFTFEIIEDDIGLISYNSCTFLDQFPGFLEESFTEMKSKGIDKLIIDVRLNPGGDSRLNDTLLSYITKKPYRQMTGRMWKVSDQVKNAVKNYGIWDEFFSSTFRTEYSNTPSGQFIEQFDTVKTVPVERELFFDGEVCILQGPSTFSSANMFVDAVKTFDLATIIGEPSGELTNDYGEVVTFYVKQTQVYLTIASTYDIGASGNTDEHSVVLPDIYADDAMKDGIEWLRKN
jgi:hypothetical protein